MTSALLTARAVAELLGVSAETVLRWTRRGELPAIRLPGGAIRFREDEHRGVAGRAGDARTRSANHPDGRRPAARLTRVSHPEDEEHQMPATQRGQAYRLGPNRWGLRYYDADGNRRRKSPVPVQVAPRSPTTAT